MGIEGKVAKVLNTRELVLNKGASDGVENGMKFNVQGMVAIVDPDSKEDLGCIWRSKISVEVVQVEPRFAIARTFETYQEFDPMGGVFDALSQMRSRTMVTKPKKIRPGPSQEYREDSVDVSVGDPVAQIEFAT